MWNTKCGSLPQLGCILVFSSHGLRIPSGRPQNTPKTSTMPSETYFSPCGATSFHFIIIEARSFDPCPFRKTVSRSFHGRFGDEFDAPVAWKSTPTHHGLLTWAKNSKNKENRRCLKNDFHIWWLPHFGSEKSANCGIFHSFHICFLEKEKRYDWVHLFSVYIWPKDHF